MPRNPLAIIKIMANLFSADTEAFCNRSTFFTLFTLVALWAVKLYTTWKVWGNLTFDSGGELYFPSMLAQRKQLYRDLWFPFGPGALYFTSFLIRSPAG
jgi:hypothetical protein